MNEEPEFNCAGKAEREGQPKPFVLIASDPLAPWLVEIWEALSRSDVGGALSAFAGMVDVNANRYAENPRTSAKLNSAALIAVDMRNWRLRQGLK
jgi:hypothetical protein